MIASVNGESQASPPASRYARRTFFGVALIACQFAALAYSQQFFGDIRNLDDTHVKSHFVPPAYPSIEEWRHQGAHIREQILVSAGLVPFPPRNPLNPRRTSRSRHGSFYIEKVVIEPMPGFHLAGNLYVPLSASATSKAPAVLVPHGHWKHGRAHQAPVYSVPALCANLATQGYVAFAWDMIGYGDTRQLPHHFGDSTSEQLWSFSSMGLQLWDSIRAVDFLSSLPEVDASRIGVTGSSGGGTQAFLLAAVDERLRVAAPVDMVSATFQGDDNCEEAPGLRVGTNNLEIAAMMAPKPMLLVASTRDWSKNTPTEEYPWIRSIYDLFGRPDRLSYAQIDAEHNFNQASREAVYAFFARYLKGASEVASHAYKETFLETIKNEDLVFGDKPEHLIGAPGYEQLFANWRDSAQRQTTELSRSDLRERMQATIGAEWPEHVQTFFALDQMLLTRGRGERIPVQWMPGAQSGKAVLVVNPDGSDAAHHTQFVKDLQNRGSAVLLMDAYQTGAAKAPTVARLGDELTYHRTDDEYRVQDILTGIAWLHERNANVRLHCSGRASAWCLLAASVSPVPVVLEMEPIHSPASDEDLKRLVYVPGLQRAGGLRVARMLTEQVSEFSASTPTENNAMLR